jgi:hypothetical protein
MVSWSGDPSEILLLAHQINGLSPHNHSAAPLLPDDYLPRKNWQETAEKKWLETYFSSGKK